MGIGWPANLTEEQSVPDDDPGHEVGGVGELVLGAAVSDSVDGLDAVKRHKQCNGKAPI